MASALVISGALANCGPNAPRDDFLEFLAQEAPDMALFQADPAPGSIMGAALDWQGVIGTGADLIGYAGALWAAYERFVRPRRKTDGGPDAFLLINVQGAGKSFAQFSIGSETADRDSFMERFMAQVSRLRSEGDTSDEELFAWLSAHGQRIRMRAGAEGSSHSASSNIGSSEWETEVIPILRWVKRAESGGCPAALGLRPDLGRVTFGRGSFEAVAAHMGLQRDQLVEQLIRMVQNGLLHGVIVPGGGGYPALFRNMSVTAEGLRAIGVWPSKDLTPETFRTALEGVLQRTTDPEKRGRLQTFLDGAGKLGWELVVEAMRAGMQATVSGAMGG